MVYYKLLDVASPVEKRSPRRPTSEFPCNNWYNDECREAKKIANEFSKSNKLHSEVNKERYGILKSNYKRIIQKVKRNAKQKDGQELDKMLESKNHAKFWKTWGKYKRKSIPNDIPLARFVNCFQKQQTPPHIDYFDYEGMANLEHTVEEFTFGYNSDMIEKTVQSLLDSPFTQDEIQYALRLMKTNKATGTDGVPSEFLKYGGEDLVDVLHVVFNCILISGNFPERWAEGIISPLHKKGDRDNPENYRKITIMNSTCKLFEIILNNRLKFSNEMLDINDPLQNGFIENGRTSDNLFILYSAIKIAQADHKPLY